MERENQSRELRNMLFEEEYQARVRAYQVVRQNLQIHCLCRSCAANFLKLESQGWHCVTPYSVFPNEHKPPETKPFS